MKTFEENIQQTKKRFEQSFGQFQENFYENTGLVKKDAGKFLNFKDNFEKVLEII